MTKVFDCNQQKISKSSEVPEALGVLDELNAFLGFVKVHADKEPRIANALREAQENLFIVQAEVAGADKHLAPDAVGKMEVMIGEIEKEIPPITGFSIAGGTELSALLDIVRTLARRAERRITAVKEMNLRGKFTTDKDGRFGFRSILPAGYPIPIDGPVGELLAAQGRHNMRPAHLHFLIFKPGFKTLISQVYVNGAPYLDSDVQFGVTRALIGNFVRHDGPAPTGDVTGEWYSLDQTFVMEPGKSRLPKPPIQ